MVKMMENPIKTDDFGCTIIFGNTHIDEKVMVSNMDWKQ